MTTINTVDRMIDWARESVKEYSKSPPIKRRAVSTAYYAVFHEIAKLCAREILPSAPLDGDEFIRVYRALEHQSLKSCFQKQPLCDIDAFKAIGVLIVRLQSERHKADYSPPGARFSYTVDNCERLIDAASDAIKRLRRLNEVERKTLMIALLIKSRAP